MTKDNGGLAFPTSMDVEFLRTPAGKLQSGMTLRDWFAGQALTALIPSNGSTFYPNIVARDAYTIADQMIMARDAHLLLDMPITEPIRTNDGEKA